MESVIRVNGERQALLGATVEDILRGRGVDLSAQGIAVALNGTVVPKVRWPDTMLQPGDELEIVKPFSGG
jgi:sulfur carrier protein